MVSSGQSYFGKGPCCLCNASQPLDSSSSTRTLGGDGWRILSSEPSQVPRFGTYLHPGERLQDTALKGRVRVAACVRGVPVFN